MLLLSAFRAKFPDFSDVVDATVNAYLGEANAEIPEEWADHDLAAGYLAAHLMAVNGLGASAADVGMTAVSTGKKMERVGDTAVAYGAHSTQPGSTMAGRYGTTSYGVRYLEIIRRNVPAVDIVF